ncbi:MAG TPA: hypothetical protein VF459_07525 [Caulobacteraceae bacterium]
MASPVVPDLVLFDSRLPESAAFAKQTGGRPAPAIDIAGEDAVFWRGARAGFGVAAGHTLVGMTMWSDWVCLRAALEPLGWRLAHEMRTDFRPGAGIRNPWVHLQAGDQASVKNRRAFEGPRDLSLFTWVMR